MSVVDLLWIPGVYVVTVYPFIKYIQLIRADLREKAEPNPVSNIIAVY